MKRNNGLPCSGGGYESLGVHHRSRLHQHAHQHHHRTSAASLDNFRDTMAALRYDYMNDHE